jgi:hypothetical protein
MKILVDYKTWATFNNLSESTQSDIKIFLSVDLEKNSGVHWTHRAQFDRMEKVFKKIQRLFPTSEIKNRSVKSTGVSYLELTIFQDKFEDSEGNFKALTINTPKISKKVDEILENEENNIDFRTLVTKWIETNSKERTVRKADTSRENAYSANKIIEAILNDEFMDYDKARLIERISSDILEEHCENSSDDFIISQIESAMISQASDGLAGDPDEIIIDLVANLILCIEAEEAVEVFKSSNIIFQIVDLGSIESSIEKKMDGILIDYSTLSESELDILIQRTAELVRYLAHTATKYGKDAKRVALNHVYQILDHFENYPKEREKLVSITKAYLK